MSDWQKRFKVVPAVYVILRKDTKILFLKRANTGYRDGYYSLPAGHFDGGEFASKAAIRETQEEVGVTVLPRNLKLVHTNHVFAQDGDHERIHLYFEALKWQGTPYNAEPHKSTGIKWIDDDKLSKEKIIPEVRLVLQNIAAGEPYSEIDRKYN